MAGCSDNDASGPPENGAPVETSAPATETPDASAPAASRESRPRIVALGDSLTAGLGLDPDESFPALLQERIDQEGLDFQVVNAGVSGDTSAGGLRRLALALEGDVRVLIVALGGNDGLRGLPPADLRANLAAMIERAQSRQIAVVLAGMEAPPNLGAEYTRAFREVYSSLAKEYGVVLLPFLLADVAGMSDLNQSDGIHPNVEGTRIVANHVWDAVSPLLQDGHGMASPRPAGTSTAS